MLLYIIDYLCSGIFYESLYTFLYLFIQSHIIYLWGRQRIKIQDGIAAWLGRSTAEMFVDARDREKWKVMIAYACNRHGNWRRRIYIKCYVLTTIMCNQRIFSPHNVEMNNKGIVLFIIDTTWLLLSKWSTGITIKRMCPNRLGKTQLYNYKCYCWCSVTTILFMQSYSFHYSHTNAIIQYFFMQYYIVISLLLQYYSYCNLTSLQLSSYKYTLIQYVSSNPEPSHYR